MSCHLPVSCRSLVDRRGSLGNCKPQIYFIIINMRVISKVSYMDFLIPTVSGKNPELHRCSCLDVVAAQKFLCFYLPLRQSCVNNYEDAPCFYCWLQSVVCFLRQMLSTRSEGSWTPISTLCLLKFFLSLHRILKRTSLAGEQMESPWLLEHDCPRIKGRCIGILQCYHYTEMKVPCDSQTLPTYCSD